MLWPWKVIRKQPARVGFTISLSFGSRKAQCSVCSVASSWGSWHEIHEVRRCKKCCSIFETWSCVFNALSSALVCSEFTLSWGVIILSNPNAVPVIILFLIDSEESATQLNTSMNIYCNSKGGSGCLLMSEVTTQTSQCPNSENCCLLSCDRFLIEIVKCLLILGNHLYNHVQSVCVSANGEVGSNTGDRESCAGTKRCCWRGLYVVDHYDLWRLQIHPEEKVSYQKLSEYDRIWKGMYQKVVHDMTNYGQYMAIWYHHKNLQL